MRHLSVCEYLLEGDRQPDHITPYQILRAVKGLPFDGHAAITVGGVQQRIDFGDREPAVAWAVARLGAKVFARYDGEALTIVPVPGPAHATPEKSWPAAGSMHHLGSALAEVLRARGIRAHVFPLLCWKAAIQSAREGGPPGPTGAHRTRRALPSRTWGASGADRRRPPCRQPPISLPLWSVIPSRHRPDQPMTSSAHFHRRTCVSERQDVGNYDTYMRF